MITTIIPKSDNQLRVNKTLQRGLWLIGYEQQGNVIYLAWASKGLEINKCWRLGDEGQ